MRNGHFIKDLRVVSNRPLRNMIIVDNSMLAFSNQLENGIYVEAFNGSRRDRKLNALVPLLKSLAGREDPKQRLCEFTGIPKLYQNFVHAKEKSF